MRQSRALTQAGKEQREGVFGEWTICLGQEEDASPNTLWRG